MPDKKLTDNEVVKAFRECCVKLNGNFCDECQYNNKGMCNDIQMATDILDLINRKDEELNRLQAENERLKNHIQEGIDLAKQIPEMLALTKAKAYKEFADRLKNEIISDTAYGCDTNQHTGYYDYQIKIGDIPEYIDNLLKELVGEDNE